MLVKESRMKGEGMNYTQTMTVRVLKSLKQLCINAPWRQVLPNMEI